MSCSDVLDRLEELVDDALPPEEASWREAHIRSCDACARHLADARRFNALLAAEGSEALQDWHAHRLAAHAARTAEAAQPEAAPPNGALAGAPAGAAPIRALPLWRRAGLRYAAAAAVLAAGLVAGVGAFGPGGPEVLAAGRLLTLDAGVEALTGPGREVRCERTLRIFVQPSTDGARVRIDGGAALFRIEEQRHCHIETPGGIAKADGSVFLLEVRQDESVAVSVLTGELRFADAGGDTQEVAAGERLEVDVDRRAHVVSRARLAEAELNCEMHTLDVAELQAELELLSADNRALREAAGGAAGAAAGGDAATSASPWDELGAALRGMLAHPVLGFGPPVAGERSGQKAMGAFYVHADAIEELTGVTRPLDAITHPAFLEEVATGFMDALAPDTHAACREAGADAMRAAAQRLQFVLDGDPVPTELLAARQQFAREVLLAVRGNLGEEAADDLAASLPRGWSPLHVVPMGGDGAPGRVTAWWARKLDLDDSQAAGLAPLVERYVAETQAVQQTIEDRLGSERAASILYPVFRPPFVPRERGATGTTGASAENGGKPRRQWTPPTVDERLGRLEAELAIARPRVEFERALLGLLREDQRRRGLGKSFGLPTFRATSR